MAKFFIGRPIVAMVIAILMVIIGFVSMAGLPTAQFPNIAPPEIQVKATYPGADAQTVEQSVATPIEQQMSGVDNMNYMYSNNANNGQMTLTANFDIKTDPSTDQILAQMRTNQANSQLPIDVVNYGVTVQKSTSAPLMLIDLFSPKGTYDNVFMANYSYINLNDQLTRVPGIASVTVFGAGQYSMRCWVKPDQLAKLGVTVPEIIKAIQTQNTVNPAGQIGGEPVPKGQEFTYAVRAQGRLLSQKEFGQIIIRASTDGSILRLKDVARLLGFSINALSLFGLVLAIGIVVDDAIVVVEAVEHHIEHGMSPKDAAYKAMEEVSGPVVAIALILSAVFIPTAFIPGITGRLYQQFAITIAISVIFSAFNALSLSPALAALLLKPKKESRGPLGAFFRWFNRMFGRATDGYVSLCGGLIRKAGLSMLLLLGVALAAGWFGSRLPGGFLPDEDQGYVFAGLQLPNAASLQRNDDASRKIEDMILKTPGVHSVTSELGFSMLSGAQNTYSSFFWIRLKEWA